MKRILLLTIGLLQLWCTLPINALERISDHNNSIINGIVSFVKKELNGREADHYYIQCIDIPQQPSSFMVTVGVSFNNKPESIYSLLPFLLKFSGSGELDYTEADITDLINTKNSKRIPCTEAHGIVEFERELRETLEAKESPIILQTAEHYVAQAKKKTTFPWWISSTAKYIGALGVCAALIYYKKSLPHVFTILMKYGLRGLIFRR